MKLSEIKREQIIKAATREFLKQGFQNCSMDTIAQNAEVSKRTVYNHFNSKEELFLSILEHLSADDHPVFDQDFSSDQSIEDQLLEIARIEIDILQSKDVQQYARILLGELMRSDEMVQLFESKRPSCHEGFIVWLDKSIAEGQLSVTNNELASEQFFGLLKTHAFWPTLFNKQVLDSESKEQAASSTVTLFMNTYKT
ncbi:MAG: TetR family transcriptional regulator [uncultured Thiotrichaceae bacterium]|uniref:TetR family transcriptional regulator n=1 Tax=uncultured Thiotrichaceae bacterium TaxID=298394 RepID=A0A6S6SVF2_9GAMM|nr:MAG: TetR family transcriptional regulator [uncultured Thiotrichaceae bacterium]